MGYQVDKTKAEYREDWLGACELLNEQDNGLQTAVAEIYIKAIRNPVPQ